MFFLQDPSFFSMGMWSIGAGALGAAALALLLANTDVFLSKPQKAALEYLEDIDLKTLEKGKEQPRRSQYFPRCWDAGILIFFFCLK
jgi:hypothetical protein